MNYKGEKNDRAIYTGNRKTVCDIRRAGNFQAGSKDLHGKVWDEQSSHNN